MKVKLCKNVLQFKSNCIIHRGKRIEIIMQQLNKLYTLYSFILFCLQILTFFFFPFWEFTVKPVYIKPCALQTGVRFTNQTLFIVDRCLVDEGSKYIKSVITDYKMCLILIKVFPSFVQIGFNRFEKLWRGLVSSEL